MTITELIALFEYACLDHFGDLGSMRAAFVSKGFVVRNSDMGVGEEYDQLFLRANNVAKGVEGSLGEYPILDSGLYSGCSMEAFVAKPDEINAQEIASTVAPGGPASIDGLGRYKAKWLTPNGLEAVITLQPPTTEVTESAAGDCQREWTKLKIDISVKID